MDVRRLPTGDRLADVVRNVRQDLSCCLVRTSSRVRSRGLVRCRPRSQSHGRSSAACGAGRRRSRRMSSRGFHSVSGVSPPVFHVDSPDCPRTLPARSEQNSSSINRCSIQTLRFLARRRMTPVSCVSIRSNTVSNLWMDGQTVRNRTYKQWVRLPCLRRACGDRVVSRNPFAIL